jgi:adhesin transport system outer membrane protein
VSRNVAIVKSRAVIPFVAACALVSPAAAQTVGTPAPTPPANSLVVDPQQGATPRPIAPALAPQVPPPATVNPTPPTAVTTTPPSAALSLQPLRGPADPVGEGGSLPSRDGALPGPSGDPLKIDPASDPVLKLALPTADANAFRSAIRAVVDRNPSNEEAEARRDEARAARNEARALQYPTVDGSMSYFRTIDRFFSNDPQNILERSRPRFRTDALLRVQQPIIDFGTTGSRISAGNRRFEASVATIDDVATQIAMSGVSAWYQVFGYRALVQLATNFVEGQRALKGAIEQRITQGYAAPGDLAQVDSYIATAEAQLASFRRSLASAEASYEALTGTPAPAGFGRAPTFETPRVSQEKAQQDAETTPQVRAAKLVAEAARYDRKTAKSNALPGLSVGVDAGRYGVFENDGDYDIRGSVQVSTRIGGGAKQRIDQADARARGAEATFERVRQDAVRLAATAWADVEALEASEAALKENYIATRQSRDVLAERFRVARGTLFDLLASETNYFNVAARYVETVTELDIARYTLLARRGKLLEAFDIEPARMDRK